MARRIHVGIYGMGPMGISLARNLARNNFNVGVANRTVQEATDLIADIQKYKEAKRIELFPDVEELMKKLEGPIIILIPTGDPQEDLVNNEKTSPVDDLIFHGSFSKDSDGKVRNIRPLTKLVNTKKHIIIDAGNTHPYATSLRDLKLAKMNIPFLGMGISGGEMGALKGPAIMPGGASKTYKKVAHMLTKIAAQYRGTPCCSLVGPAGAGHLVKIVHNGIEYAIMQAIAEAYLLLKQGLNLDNDELKKFFEKCNTEVFRSYLLDITVHILAEKKNDTFIVDEILDSAGAKGTGKWTTQIASDLGIPSGAIYGALEGRQLSNKKDQRVALASILKHKRETVSISKSQFFKQVREALWATIIISYIQGFSILQAAANELAYTAPHKNYIDNAKKKIPGYSKRDFETKLDFQSICDVWRSGCIIRSNLLSVFKGAFSQIGDSNLLTSTKIQKYFKTYFMSWKKSVITALTLDVPYNTTSSTLNFYNAMRTDRMPANLTQAQRDLFGAHTFRKLHDEGIFHHDWGKKYSITAEYISE